MVGNVKLSNEGGGFPKQVVGSEIIENLCHQKPC